MSEKREYILAGKNLIVDFDEIPPIVNKIPYYQTIGMELVRVDRHGSVIKLKLDRRHGNFWGIVHGGVIASLMDSACSLSMVPYLDKGETMITISLHIDYIASNIEGDLTGRGKVVHRSRRLFRTEASITDETERLIAKGYATLIDTTSNHSRPKRKDGNEN